MTSSRLTETWTDEARERSIEVRQANSIGKVEPTKNNQHSSALPSHDEMAGVIGKIFDEGREMLAGGESAKQPNIDLKKRYDRSELQQMDDKTLDALKSSDVPRTQRLAATIMKERNPKPLTAEETAKRESQVNQMQAERQEREKRDAAVQLQSDRLKASHPEVHSKADTLGEFSERTPGEAKRYVDAAISWEHHDPSGQAIDHAVSELQKRGVTMEQKGANGSWYGKTEDGKSVRVGDHLGYDAHDIDMVFSRDAPMTKSRAMAHVGEELSHLPLVEKSQVSATPSSKAEVAPLVKEGGEAHAQFFRDLHSNAKPISSTNYDEIKQHVEGLKTTHNAPAMANLAKDMGITMNKTMASSKTKMGDAIHQLHTDRLESFQRTRF